MAKRPITQTKNNLEMNLIDKIYKPFVFARYSLFLKSNKNGKSVFPIDEEIRNAVF